MNFLKLSTIDSEPWLKVLCPLALTGEEFVAGGFARELWRGGTPDDAPDIDIFCANIERAVKRVAWCGKHGSPSDLPSSIDYEDVESNAVLWRKWKVGGRHLDVNTLILGDVESCMSRFAVTLEQFAIIPPMNPLADGEWTAAALSQECVDHLKARTFKLLLPTEVKRAEKFTNLTYTWLNPEVAE